MIYFASDFHLGINARKSSSDREREIVNWLDSIKGNAEEIYFVGDMFDFWFEYGPVIPKGFTRFIGKVGELVDAGIKVIFFTGNHDMWMFDYFEQEVGVTIHREPIVRKIGDTTFLIGHGDGLGPGDHGYKMIKKIFANKACQWLFSFLHPTIGFWIANFWSKRSRDKNREEDVFLGPDKEWLVQYCENYKERNDVDVFVFGHRHLPIDYKLKTRKGRYINLGDWLNYNSYGIYNGKEFSLAFYENPTGRPFGMDN